MQRVVFPLPDGPTMAMLSPFLTSSKFTTIIAANAEIVEVAEWGKRRLAYLIDDKPEGYYTVVTFKSESAFPAELERLYNIDENVMRSMVLNLEFEPVAKAAEVAAEAEVAAPAEETVSE